MSKKLKRGFTLTELIIVIVIIGILAAVLIPSISGYVKKAKISRGEQEAREMNTILSAEAIYQDRAYFEPNEIKQLAKEADFELKSQLDDYRFWYDASSNQVKFLSNEEAFGTSNSKNVASVKGFSQDCIEAFSSAHPEYRYVDNYDDVLLDVIDTIRNDVFEVAKKNAVSKNVYTEIDAKITSAVDTINKLKLKGVSSVDNIRSSIKSHISSFDTAHTIYIDSENIYNRAYYNTSNITDLAEVIGRTDNITFNGSKISADIQHVVFASDTTRMGLWPTPFGSDNYDIKILCTVVIPSTVSNVQEYAFAGVTFVTSVVVYDTTIVDPQLQLHNDIVYNAMQNAKSNINYIQLHLNEDFFISYDNVEARLDKSKYSSVTKNDFLKVEGNNFDLAWMFYDGNELVFDTDGYANKGEDTDTKVYYSEKDADEVISKYLIPSIEFKGDKIKFAKMEKFILRRSISNNVCIYTGILVDSDLNGYKLDSFGYVTDVNWEIDQDLIKVVDGEKQFGDTNATLRVFIPSYVYNFSNFKNCKIEVTVLPQYVKTKEELGLLGKVEVFDGFQLSSQTYTFTLNDGVYDNASMEYFYEKEVDLTKITIEVNDENEQTSTVTANRLKIYRIAIYQELENGEKLYLFIRNYK